MNCPRCGGPMEDIRANKKNPKSPDFRCADVNCVNDKGYRTGAWLEPRRAQRPQGNGPAPQVARGPKWTWAQLHNLYTRSLVIARQELRDIKNVTPTDLVSATACIFIAATRDGVQEITGPNIAASVATGPVVNNDSEPAF